MKVCWHVTHVTEGCVLPSMSLPLAAQFGLVWFGLVSSEKQVLWISYLVMASVLIVLLVFLGWGLFLMSDSVSMYVCICMYLPVRARTHVSLCVRAVWCKYGTHTGVRTKRVKDHKEGGVLSKLKCRNSNDKPLGRVSRKPRLVNARLSFLLSLKMPYHFNEVLSIFNIFKSDCNFNMLCLL